MTPTVIVGVGERMLAFSVHNWDRLSRPTVLGRRVSVAEGWKWVVGRLDELAMGSQYC